MAQAASANCYPHPQPLPSRLRACPLPANLKLDQTPASRGLVGEGNAPVMQQLFCVEPNVHVSLLTVLGL